MKKFGLSTVILLSLLLGAWFLSACGKKEQPVKQPVEGKVEAEPAKPGAEEVSAEDVKRKTDEALEAAKAYTMQQKQEYQQKMEAELNDFNRQVDIKVEELKAKAEKSEAEAKEELDKQIKELREKQKDAQKKLDELKSASGKAWDDLKSEMDAKMNDLKNFIKDLLPPNK